MVAHVLVTDRLQLRLFEAADAPFFLALLNDPDWLRFIGDRGVRTLEDACGYALRGRAMCRRLGFGLWLVERRDDGSSIGICGLIKRDSLVDVDIGFAFLPSYRGNGYAKEAATATLTYGREVVGLRRIVAITSPDNEASIALLTKIGMSFEERVRLSGEVRESLVFGWNDPRRGGRENDEDAVQRRRTSSRHLPVGK